MSIAVSSKPRRMSLLAWARRTLVTLGTIKGSRGLAEFWAMIPLIAFSD